MSGRDAGHGGRLRVAPARAWCVAAALLSQGLVGCSKSPPPRYPRGAQSTSAEATGDGQSEEAPDPEAAFRPARRPPVEGAVELTLATSTGELLILGDMRGQPILLYFFATFDVAS